MRYYIKYVLVAVTGLLSLIPFNYYYKWTMANYAWEFPEKALIAVLMMCCAAASVALGYILIGVGWLIFYHLYKFGKRVFT